MPIISGMKDEMVDEQTLSLTKVNQFNNKGNLCVFRLQQAFND
jgi:hypothetical protein